MFSMKVACFFLLVIMCVGYPLSSRAQDSSLIKQPITDSLARMALREIQVIGNQKTKTFIILREIPIKPGDSIQASRIYETLERSRFLIYNTNLFSEVNVYPVFVNGSEFNIFVMVRERWYIYPTPQFKLVDRNVNEWINIHNASFNRVTYGLKFAHYNFSGRADQLRVFLLNGFNRMLAVSYSNPYSNAKLTEGFGFTASITQSREVQYKTDNSNKLLRFTNDKYVRTELLFRANYQLRRGYYRRHIFFAGYHHHDLNDSIKRPEFNPQYLNNGRNYGGFPFIGYTFQYINTDNVNYPLTGKRYTATILKQGTGFTGGMNLLRIDAQYSKYTPFGKNWYGNWDFYGTVKAPFRTAYINQRAMGYQDFYMRGLENYVIDGYAAAIAKYTVKKKIVSFQIPLPWNIKSIPYIPFAFYAKTYADIGWSENVSELNNRLNNRFLYSGGIGIDIISLYDIFLQVEYSINPLGEKGLFLHTKTNF